jgi:CubicO group peptidase (beta-lactamase class C family)
MQSSIVLLTLFLACVLCIPISPNIPKYKVQADALCLQSFDATPFPPVIPDEIQSATQRLEAYLQTLINSNTNAPGIIYQVSYLNSSISNSFGLANKSSSEQMDLSTPSRIGSVSKTFVAMLLFKLVSMNKLALDDPLVKYVPEFAIIDPFQNSNGTTITFRHLLTHTSGLQREAPVNAVTTSDVLTALRSIYLIAPVGTVTRYSNFGFALLGHILAEYVVNDGSSFEELTQEYIFSPLGMTNSGWDYSIPGLMERLAVGYDAQGNALPFVNFGWDFPCGSAYSTVGDLSIFLQSFHSTSNLLNLSSTLVQQVLDPDSRLDDGLSFMGSPWEIRVSSNLTNPVPYSHLVRNKGGNIGGYTALVSFVYHYGLSIVVLLNGAADEFAISDSSYSIFFPALASFLSTNQPPMNPPSVNYSNFLGVYQIPGAGSEYEAVVEYTTIFGSNYLTFTVSGLINNLPLKDMAAANSAFPFGVFQGTVPSHWISCLNQVLTAIDKQYVIFGVENNLVTNVTMYGWIPGLYWNKI